MYPTCPFKQQIGGGGGGLNYTESLPLILQLKQKIVYYSGKKLHSVGGVRCDQ